MPAELLSFRASCGSFIGIYISFMAKREIRKLAMRVKVVKLRNRATGVIFGILLTLIFLGDLIHRAGDVEKNPGPGPGSKETTRQTRLTSSGKVTNNDNVSSSPSPQSTSAGKSDINLCDVMQALSAMNLKFDALQNDVKETKDICTSLMNEMSVLKKEIIDLKNENESMKKEHCRLNERIEQLERRNDNFEDRLKRNNLIFYGIPRTDEEKSWQDCEKKVKDLIADKLELEKDYNFDRVHRLSARKDSPIIAKFTFFKEKEEIMKARGKLKGSNIFIGEDFSKRVRDVRKGLSSHLKTAKAEGKKATMIFDHLLIEGKKFALGGDNKLISVK